MEQAIARLLRYGTWIASLVIAAGLAAEWLNAFAAATPPGLNGTGMVKAGVALLILLPVSRVALMFFLFLRQRDAAYMAISALVLAIIGAGFLAGL
jgi:uncharacterized membrane protein